MLTLNQRVVGSSPTGGNPLFFHAGRISRGKFQGNRLELTPVRANADSRYKKIVAHLDAMQQFFVTAFVQQYVVPPMFLDAHGKLPSVDEVLAELENDAG